MRWRSKKDEKTLNLLHYVPIHSIDIPIIKNLGKKLGLTEDKNEQAFDLESTTYDAAALTTFGDKNEDDGNPMLDNSDDYGVS
jgi:hypothetical protein